MIPFGTTYTVARASEGANVGGRTLDMVAELGSVFTQALYVFVVTLETLNVCQD